MHSTSTSRLPTNRWLKHSLTLVFAMSLILGTGPGLLLVNRPETICDIPIVYAWGILWYAVQVGVVVIAFVFLWNRLPDDEDEHSREPLATGNDDREQA